jgi:hypothetical protein
VIGVESIDDWPCGQDSQPKPGSHRRRYVCHEARGGVTGFDCGAGAYFYGRYPIGPVASPTAVRSGWPPRRAGPTVAPTVPEQGCEFVLSASQRQRPPMEYAVEMNQPDLAEMESSIG